MLWFLVPGSNLTIFLRNSFTYGRPIKWPWNNGWWRPTKHHWSITTLSMIENPPLFTQMTGKTDHKTIKKSCSVWGHSTLTHANGPPEIRMKCNAQISRSRQQSYNFPSELFRLLRPKKEAPEQRLVKTNQASSIHYDSFNDREPPHSSRRWQEKLIIKLLKSLV